MLIAAERRCTQLADGDRYRAASIDELHVHRLVAVHIGYRQFAFRGNSIRLVHAIDHYLAQFISFIRRQRQHNIFLFLYVERLVGSRDGLGQFTFDIYHLALRIHIHKEFVVFRSIT